MGDDYPKYVQAEFYEEDRWDPIIDAKEDHGATWKQMLDFGRRYIEAVEEAEKLDPDLLLQNEQTDPGS